MTFYDWLIGNAGIPGDYTYTSIHWQTLLWVLLAVLVILIPAFCHRNSSQLQRRLLVMVALFQLSFEIFWRLIYLLIKGDSILCWWPMYPCNLNGILIPLAALLRAKHMKKMFYLFGFVGGVLTFLMPDGIFSTDVFVFPILKSVLQHTGILFIPALEYISNQFRPSLKDMGWVSIGCIIHLINCEGINRLLGFTGDYMFFRSGLPFVIPGIPQFITLSVFALLVLSLLSFLSDVKGSVAFIRKNRDFKK